ncbi:olfactory receptor 2AT4-like [Lissotriton helveticus]
MKKRLIDYEGSIKHRKQTTFLRDGSKYDSDHILAFAKKFDAPRKQLNQASNHATAAIRETSESEVETSEGEQIANFYSSLNYYQSILARKEERNQRAITREKSSLECKFEQISFQSFLKESKIRIGPKSQRKIIPSNRSFHRVPNIFEMAGYNESQGTTDFILTGFLSLQNFQIPLFIFFLFLYLLILIGNIMILSTVLLDRTLHKPMYFFLSNLSVLDIVCTTTTVPKMLAMFLFEANTISFSGCFLQMYFFHSFTVNESFLLVVMAYDRYVAICSPLHYATKMTKRKNVLIATSSWISAFIVPVPAVIQTSQLHFCGSTHVEHCFCDHLSVVQAACSDATFQTFLGFSIAMVVSIVPLMLVSLSYLNIIISVLKLNSKESQKRAFSTCSAHLIVVTTFYASMAISYISYRADMTRNIHVMGSIAFAILTPMVNPIIYTLRNKEVKDAMTKILNGESNMVVCQTPWLDKWECPCTTMERFPDAN